jgi:hypothetical protein
MPILRYNGSLITWTVVSLTSIMFKSCIFHVWLPFVLYCEHVHSHDFVLLLLVAWTILLHSCIHMKSWKSRANHRPVWTLENFQWCEEPCSAGAAILRDRSLVHSFACLTQPKIVHNLSFILKCKYISLRSSSSGKCSPNKHILVRTTICNSMGCIGIRTGAVWQFQIVKNCRKMAL